MGDLGVPAVIAVGMLLRVILARVLAGVGLGFVGEGVVFEVLTDFAVEFPVVEEAEVVLVLYAFMPAGGSVGVAGMLDLALHLCLCLGCC